MTTLTTTNAPATSAVITNSEKLENIVSYIKSKIFLNWEVENLESYQNGFKVAASLIYEDIKCFIEATTAEKENDEFVRDLIGQITHFNPLPVGSDTVSLTSFSKGYSDTVLDIVGEICEEFNTFADINNHGKENIEQWCKLIASHSIHYRELRHIFGEGYKSF